MFITKIDGRICRVTEFPDGKTPRVEIKAVVGFRRRSATAGRRPGPGWVQDPDPGKRKWVKVTAIVESREVRRDSVTECDSWPVGLEEHGFPSEALSRIAVPIMQRSMASHGAIARRVRPNVAVSVSRAPSEHEGIPMPTEEEWDAALTAAWEQLKPAPKKRRRNSSRGRSIIPPEKRARSKEESVSDGTDPKSMRDELKADKAPVANRGKDPGIEDDGTAAGPVGPLPGHEEPTESAEPAGVMMGEDAASEPTSTFDKSEQSGTPDGVVVPEGHFWSTALGANLKDDVNGQMAHSAVEEHGWPPEYVDGASKTRKGERGFTLAYMNKNDYDPERHG